MAWKRGENQAIESNEMFFSKYALEYWAVSYSAKWKELPELEVNT